MLPDKLSKTYKGISDICWKCNQMEGTLLIFGGHAKMLENIGITYIF